MRIFLNQAALWLGVGLLLGLAVASPARAEGPDLSGVAFKQNLNATIPLNLTFRDERNHVVHLRDYFGKRPVILSLNYLRCANLCPLELQDLTTTLGQLGMDAGQQFQVLTVSIDPRDTPVIAAGKRQVMLGMYNRPADDAGWHFLTGDDASIHALAQAVGFSYAYDAQTDDYIHPLGVVVLTAAGKVARYLYGLDFPAQDLRLALVEASQNQIGSPVDQVLLFCYHYDPVNGKYSAAAMNFVQLGGLATVLAIGGFLFVLWRGERKRRGSSGAI